MRKYLSYRLLSVAVPNMFDPRLLRAFVTIFETGGFTALSDL
jgi:hypothetical protein